MKVPVKKHIELILTQKFSGQMDGDELNCADWTDGFDGLLESAREVAIEAERLRALNGEMVEALRSLHSVAERYCDAVDGWAEDIGGEDPNKVLRELGPETMRARAILAKMENEDE